MSNIPKSFHIHLTHSDVHDALKMYIARQFPEYGVTSLTFELNEFPVASLVKREPKSSVGVQIAGIESGKVDQR